MSQSEASAVDIAPVSKYKPLRRWIPILLLPLMLLMRFIPDLVPNGPSMIWMFSAFGPFLVGLLVLGWWLFASRARWFEKVLGIIGLFVIFVGEQILADPSMRGPLFVVMTIPMTIVGFSIGAILFAKQLSFSRTIIALVLASLGAGFSTLTRTDGVWGNFAFELDWRWKETSESKLLAKRKIEDAESASTPDKIPTAAFQKPEWPGFRGANQDGAQRGCEFEDDWTAFPPKEVWRVSVGPAWSSFAVAGKYLVTQEQRGDNEAVVCYDAETGKQAWEQTNTSRFFEGLGGLGPRATPTISNGFIYALGAEGWLMKLSAADGTLVWKVDLRKEAQREPPMWGFSASPLVHDGLVVVHAGGKDQNGVLAFQVEDGTVAWKAAAGEMSYGSVQVVKVLGTQYLCLLSDFGAHFWEPKSGKNVLDYEWKHQGYRALQPQILDGDKLLIPTGMGSGTRLVQLKESEGALTGEVIWTSKDMKPDFNDLLVHKGYVYGFDNAIFACIDLKDGKRRWKGGRYEKGQALLLADSDLIVVVSEKGELVLLRTNPDKHEELAKIPSMNGKTWNHPVVVGDKLYVRNAEEAICYQLSVNTASAKPATPKAQ